MTDSTLTADDITLALETLALDIGRRHPRKEGIERDDLIGEAWLALHGLAIRYVAREPEPGEPPMEEWFRRRIREHLRKYVRDTLFWFLADVPESHKRNAIRVHTATKRLKARGIQRPTYEHIAQEAQVKTSVVVRMAGFAHVVVRQSIAEWCEDKGATAPGGEPALVPAFGPQPGFTPHVACPDIIAHPIAKGSLLCCMRCHLTGVEGHAALRRNRLTDPKPEPQPTVMPAEPKPSKEETRKEKRARLFASQDDANTMASRPTPTMLPTDGPSRSC